MKNLSIRLINVITLVLCIMSMTFYDARASGSSQSAGMPGAAQYISCELNYIGDMAIYGLPQTCIQEPILDKLVTAMMTFGQSTFMTTRLKIHYDAIPAYAGNCLRENRADYFNPRLNYGMCANWKLWMTGLGAALNSIASLSVGQGLPPMPGPSEYTIDYSGGPTGTVPIAFVDTATFYLFRTNVRQDRICSEIMTVAGSYMPIGCKYIQEPFPKSIYEVYGQGDQSSSGNDITQCNSVYNCSQKAQKVSKTLAPITSPIIACVREMVLRLIVSTEVCNPTQLSTATQQNLARAFAQGMDTGSMIHKFQTNMANIVSAMLAIYIVIFGVRVLTGADRTKPKDVINFVIKFILVTYFAIGINMGSGGNEMRFDGMTSIVFPLLLNGVTEIAGWLMVASNLNGLCEFPSNIYPPDADINMALWDQIDCRLAYYIGYDGLLEKISGILNDPVNHQTPPYVFFLIPALILGEPQLIMMALTYPIMIVSFIAFTLCMFVSALILILILGVLAPVFVPMALFDHTKEYFDKWWKTLFGLMIQPAVALTFMSLMFAVYDRAFYGTCIYRSVNVNYTNTDGGTQTFRSFYMSLDSDDYYPNGSNDQDAAQVNLDGCTSSLAYFLNNPMKSVFGSVNNPGLSTTGQITGSIDINPRDKKGDLPKNEQDYLNNDPKKPKLKWTNGLFTQSPKMFWEELVNLVKNFIVCFIVLSVLKKLMDVIGQFILSLSGTMVSASGGFDAGQIQKQITDKVGMAAGAAAKQVGKSKQKGKDLKKSKEKADKKDGDGDSDGGGDDDD